MHDPKCECGHEESLHSDKDDGCYACACEEFKCQTASDQMA